MFGPYQLRARVQPLLVVALPAAALVYALGISDRLLVRVAAAITTFGVMALLVSFARDRGRALQRDLWAEWGGPPTTTMLLSTSTSPAPDLAAQRQHVQRLLPSEPLLSDQRDRDDPAGSICTIERYIRYLRERTRSREQFPVVFEANVSYGFQRNLLALRPYGITVSALTIVGSLGVLVLTNLGWLHRPVWPLAGAAAIGCLGLVLWLRATSSSVQAQANDYARALLDSAEVIDSPTSIAHE